MAAVLRVHAKRDGDADAINLLLQGTHVAVTAIREAGLDPNVEDYGGKAPLHHAAESGNGDFVDALHEAGADLDARDIEGNTPLYLAVRAACAKALEAMHFAAPPRDDGSPESASIRRSQDRAMDAVRALLVAGADPDATSFDDARWTSSESRSTRSGTSRTNGSTTTHRNSWGSPTRGDTGTPATKWRRGAETGMGALVPRPGPSGPRQSGSGPSGERNPGGPKTDTTSEIDQLGPE